MVDYAKQNGHEGRSASLEDVPINDPAGLAQKLVQDAGDGGGVVLDFTGPTVVPLLQAIEQQGLIDKVVWASSTPPNDPSVAKELSSAWNGKFLINAEFNVLDSGKPDQNHMNEIRAEVRARTSRAPASPRWATSPAGSPPTRCMGIKGDITKESVNAAFKGVKNFTSDLWCKPWYFDSTVGPERVEQHRHHRDAARTATWCRPRTASRSPSCRPTRWPQIRAKETELGLNMAGP